MADVSDRHVQLSVIGDYFARGLDGVFGIEGDPAVRIVVEPANAFLAIRVPNDESVPDVTEFANLSLDVVRDEGATWHQMSVRLEDNLDEAYATLCNIADRVQLSGKTFALAVSEVLESLSELLAVRSALSLEKQVGLAGELLTLLALAAETNPQSAIKAWRGPLAEEHDFGLPAADLEVKVTTNERRQHWISSGTQLVPTGDRPLYLLSIQLTAAGAGSGWSLPSLVGHVRALKGIPGDAFDADLASAGYRKRDLDLYRSHWALRTSPAFFLVDSDFPAITRAALDSVVPNSQRIVDVRFRVDLTGLPSTQELFSFDGLPNEGIDT